MKLFSHGGREFGTDELLKTLGDLGLKSGDDVCVHSEIFSFGTSLAGKNELLGGILDTLLRAIKGGTLLVPSFSYSLCRGEIYDVKASPCLVGMLGEYARKRADFSRNADPIFSFMINGDEGYLNWQGECFGANCVYEKLANRGGKILMLGLSELAGFTYWIYLERLAGVFYRYDKVFKGQMRNQSGRLSQCWAKYFVRDLDINPSINLQKRYLFMLENGLLKSVSFAGASLVLVDAAKARDVAVGKLKREPEYFLN